MCSSKNTKRFLVNIQITIFFFYIKIYFTKILKMAKKTFILTAAPINQKQKQLVALKPLEEIESPLTR